MEQTPKEIFDSYRNVRVRGAISDIIFRSTAMPMEVFQELTDQGVAVPFDILPHEVWHTVEPVSGQHYYRFGEEMLGKDF